MKTPKRYLYQGLYNIPIIGYIVGHVSDDFFYKQSSFVIDIVTSRPEVSKWIEEHPNEILTNKKVRELKEESNDIKRSLYKNCKWKW